MQLRARALAFVPPLTCLLATAVHSQTTTRVSLDASGGQIVGESRAPSVSADGRYVAFQSSGTSVVPGDTNGLADVFVRDTLTSQTTRVSFAPGGGEFEEMCVAAAISADGTHVAFENISHSFTDMYVRDRTTGQTSLVSATPSGGLANARSGDASISADGRYVAFSSGASDLVPGDTNGQGDVFVRDVSSGTTILASRSSAGVQGNGRSGPGAISGDGRFLAFASDSTNLVADDTADLDLFLRDLQTGTTVLLTQIHPSSVASTSVAMSSDAQVVVFSTAAILDPKTDTNLSVDVFAHDVQAGTTTRVSVDSDEVQVVGDSDRPSISHDGRTVAFRSVAPTLVPGDTNAVADVFVRDLLLGTTRRASISSAGLQGNGASGEPSVSANGQLVAFDSDASDLVVGDSNGKIDVFTIDRTCTGAISTYCVAKTNSLGCVPSIGSSGMPSLSGADDFHVTASNVRNNKFGMMLWSRTEAHLPFFDGIRCVGSPFKRTPLQSSGGSASGNDCTGTYDFHFTQTYMAQQLLGAEETVHAQFWSRDPGFPVPNNIGLTNGLRFTICP